MESGGEWQKLAKRYPPHRPQLAAMNTNDRAQQPANVFGLNLLRRHKVFVWMSRRRRSCRVEVGFIVDLKLKTVSRVLIAHMDRSAVVRWWWARQTITRGPKTEINYYSCVLLCGWGGSSGVTVSCEELNKQFIVWYINWWTTRLVDLKKTKQQVNCFDCSTIFTQR